MFRFRPGQIGLQLLGFGYQRIENYVPDPQQFTGKPPVSMRTVRRRRFDVDAQPVSPQIEAPPVIPDFGLRRTPETHPTESTPPPTNPRPAPAGLGAPAEGAGPVPGS